MSLVLLDEDYHTLEEQFLAKAHLLGFDSLLPEDNLNLLLRKKIHLLLEKEVNLSLDQLNKYFNVTKDGFLAYNDEICNLRVRVEKDFTKPFRHVLFVGYTFAKQDPTKPPGYYDRNFHLEFDYY